MGARGLQLQRVGPAVGVHGASAAHGTPAPWKHVTEKAAGRQLGGREEGSSQQTLPSSPDVGADVRQAKWFSQ